MVLQQDIAFMIRSIYMYMYLFKHGPLFFGGGERWGDILHMYLQTLMIFMPLLTGTTVHCRAPTCMYSEYKHRAFHYLHVLLLTLKRDHLFPEQSLTKQIQIISPCSSLVNNIPANLTHVVPTCTPPTQQDTIHVVTCTCTWLGDSSTYMYMYIICTCTCVHRTL